MNEELKSANEEMMSMNEELQSINEELETSKEELQSLNEELTTVNNQLEGKIGELETANADLTNLLVSTDIATIFLDEQYCIRRFTPATTRLFNLIPTDVGRPLEDIASRFTGPDFRPDARAVLTKQSGVEREVQTHDGRWYIRHVHPYYTEDKRIAGVVITFIEVTEQKLAEQNLQKANQDLELRVREPHRRARKPSTNNSARRSPTGIPPGAPFGNARPGSAPSSIPRPMPSSPSMAREGWSRSTRLPNPCLNANQTK